MTTSTKAFFAEEGAAAVIRSTYTALRSIQPLEEPHPEVVQPLVLFFSIFSQNLSRFDEHCPANIEWIGPRYIEQLKTLLDQRNEKPTETLLDIFTSSYRFLCELEYTQPDDLSFELRGIKTFVDDNLEKFKGTNRQQLIYASYTMPARLTKRILEHTSLGDFKAFSETVSTAKQLKQTWDKEIEEKTTETKGLQDAISKLQTKYNFVGLVSGFEMLAEKKKNEIQRSFSALIFLGVIMIVPVVAQITFVLLKVGEIESHRSTLIYSLPALLALEFILLYFFRVVLSNFRALQAQLLQLDLRVSLCQFIQSYSEYSSKIKKTDPAALDRFEAIVFSAVTTDSEKIPATFDGIEQLAKLAATLRQK